MVKKQIILRSSLGSVFSAFDSSELIGTDVEQNRLVAISGRINNPGIFEIPEGITLKEVIELGGGIKNKKSFKAAQFGIPFGGFLTMKDLNKPLDFNLFEKGQVRNLIILSEEDCIVQFSKFYVEFLLGKIMKGEYREYLPAKYELDRIDRVLDRITKGKANMRDIYLLRYLSDIIKSIVKQNHNLILEAIDNFYHEFEEHIEEHRCYAGECPQLVRFRITEKCIGCTACARVCPVKCITGKVKEKHEIDIERCTHCGQCVVACPVNAINEGDNTLKFLRDLATPSKIVITQMAPAVRVAIGEAFGFEPGENVEKKINTALRALGVDYVFDTTWAADLTIMEEATEFQDRLERYFKEDDTVRLPILTSCCPAWVKFIEQSYPDMLDVPSTVKSPMQIFSTIAKDIWAKEKGYSRNQVTSVAIMPCLAKKYEASREEFSRGDNYDTDYVITTRELIKILKETEIDLKELEDQEFDNPLGEYSGAGIIFGRTGGVIEAATRSTIEMITGQRIENIEFEALRGWEGFRTCELSIGHIDLRIGIAHGLEEAAKMLDKIRAGEEFYHAIEIMACKGGCVGGGGQPKAMKKQETLEKRAAGLNKIDRELKVRRSHENVQVLAIYEKYLDYPMSRKAHELLHTKYFPKLKK
ncbi:MAG: [FeFe] hydrogenase, group A [Cetobacterium sp.]|uniref:[FeFe] hydrogenase, group A n=2 Tax=Cetobacterium TaxID=180162 RepID=UPI00163C49A0|nr:[FeFe] hydrogenase, group A [Cetobacterium sp. 2A]MBC2856919.1 iron hydrogenase small subunit [Cetobacterium sp. 2A]